MQTLSQKLQPLDLNSPVGQNLVAQMAARVTLNETFHLQAEQMSNPPEMTDSQLETMNKALGLTKTKQYRPYCCAAGCLEMPRMILTRTGFRCWSCGNEIGFDLRKIDA